MMASADDSPLLHKKKNYSTIYETFLLTKNSENFFKFEIFFTILPMFFLYIMIVFDALEKLDIRTL